jgi:hypothetical protein
MRETDAIDAIDASSVLREHAHAARNFLGRSLADGASDAKVVGRAGFEPATNKLKVCCSTD